MGNIEERVGKRGRHWRVKIRRRSLRPITKTFDRRSDAVQWSRMIESDIDQGRSVVASSDRKRTLAELIVGSSKRWMPSIGQLRYPG